MEPENYELERILKRIEQAIYQMTPAGASVEVQVPTPAVEVQANVRLNDGTPLEVRAEQSGTWTVGVSGQPIGVNVQNTPIVNAQQSGTWTVGITGQPLQVSVSQPDYKYATVNFNTSGTHQIVAAVTNKRIVVVAYAVVAGGSVNIQFHSGTTTAITGTMSLVQADGIAHAFPGGLFRTNVGEALSINLSAAVQVGGYVVYLEV